MGHSHGLFFFIFIFSIQLTISVQYKFLPVTWFEPRTSGIGSDRSTNWATTTAIILYVMNFFFEFQDRSKDLTIRYVIYPKYYQDYSKLSNFIKPDVVAALGNDWFNAFTTVHKKFVVSQSKWTFFCVQKMFCHALRLLIQVLPKLLESFPCDNANSRG